MTHLEYSAEHGLAFASVYPPAVLRAIATAFRTYADPIGEIEKRRERVAAPVTPLLSILDVTARVEPDDIMHTATGMTLLLARAFTHDFTRADLTMLFTSTGIPMAYAARVAERIDTPDGGVPASFGARMLQQLADTPTLPMVMFPAGAVTMAGLAALSARVDAVSTGRDVLATCRRIGLELHAASIDSILTLSESVYEMSNRALVLPSAGTNTAGGLPAPQGAVVQPTESGFIDGFINGLTSLLERGEPTTGDYDYDVESSGFTDAAEELAEDATILATPPNAPAATTRMTGGVHRQARRGRASNRLRRFAQSAARALPRSLGVASPAATVTRAVTALREQGEPIEGITIQKLMRQVDAQLGANTPSPTGYDRA